MSDLEQRVTTLEREMSALKARVDANEADVTSIPDLIKVEFRYTNSQIARLSRDVSELQQNVSGLRGTVEAMPRVIAELVTEMVAERDRRKS